MEELFDMHCHLGFTPDAAECAAKGAAAGISALSCTVVPAEYLQLIGTLMPYENVAVGLGLHPWWIADGRAGDEELNQFCSLVPDAPFIGEIGLDFSGPRDTKDCRARQIDAFRRILSACNAKGGEKLLSIHAVNAAASALDLLGEASAFGRHRVIFHWFSGTSDDLARAVRAGCLFSVGPRMLATRRGREYTRQIPLHQLLLETDMPARAGETLPPETWRAELGNALAGISQLKSMDRAETLTTINRTTNQLTCLPHDTSAK